MRLGLIGFGSIATGLIERLPGNLVTRVTALTRPGSNAPERYRAGCAPSTDAALPVHFVTDIDSLSAALPDVIVECAGHTAVRAYVPTLLRAGHDTIIASIGALADASLHDEIEQAAAQSGARIILPSGAIGGLDLLRAIVQTGGVSVIYRGMKPPEAWRGSPAETLIDLATLKKPVTFFTGTGREAALAYPKNANVVAALALAGAGFDTLQVELIADPGARGNQHTYNVVSPVCRYSMAIEATGSATNARTSVTTVLSILHEIATYRPGS